MPLAKKIIGSILKASSGTPDPLSASNNLTRFFENNPEAADLLQYINEIASLFSVSQYLSNYCMKNPNELLSALNDIKTAVNSETLEFNMKSEISDTGGQDIDAMMKSIRLFKKRAVLRITLRDVTGETDISSSMSELTRLAEAVIGQALKWSMKINIEKFGEPSDSSISLISFGKLGGEELNYSSDVDLMAVYRTEEGSTSGISGPSGVNMNRLSNHEFFCKVVELFSRLLSLHTEDGIAYRVDLRLRPQGQKGELALPLLSYKTYYESWGRTWERMMLIRARPVAGDRKLGDDFIKTIRPFVWKESIDFSEIEEIRGLKKKIDSTFTKDDIKRGYGGIREAEFFVQTFLLIYGGTNSALRTHHFLDAISALQDMKMVPEEDLETIRSHYLYLRRLEHYLQMKEDLQTHKLPASEEDLESLARKMGFPDREDFLENLRVRRMQVKNMYNSLLGTEKDVHAESLSVLEGGLNDKELAGYLLFRKVKDIESGLQHIKRIREQMRTLKTQRERAALIKVVPEFLEKALDSQDPDRALAGLVSVLPILGAKESYLIGIAEQKRLIDIMVSLFTFSSYLTGIFLSSEGYLGRLIEGLTARKSLKHLTEELRRGVAGKKNYLKVIEEYRRAEELRLWLLFLMDNITIQSLLRCLSRLADAVIQTIFDRLDIREGIAVIGFGKLGGRELNFGSDLDIIFVTDNTDRAVEAQSVLRNLTAYTDRGMLYSVDVRLRPDGSKGSLVKDIAGYRNYYLKKAHPWELQALLRARPVAGDMKLGKDFLKMASDAIKKKGSGIKKETIQDMRIKIMRELSKESEGLDIKLGPGGIEEIEFYIQYLQLQHAKEDPGILIQNTPAAIGRLSRQNILSPESGAALSDAYKYYRQLETFLRVNKANVISRGSGLTRLSAGFMGHKNIDEFLAHIESLRRNVLSVINQDAAKN